MLDSWQVKKNGDKGKKDEDKRPLLISHSTNPDSPSLSSREQLAVVSVRHREDSEPQHDDLQRIIELMDGFKASKVIQTPTEQPCNVKKPLIHFHRLGWVIIYHRLTRLELEDLSLCIFNYVITECCFLADIQGYHSPIYRIDSILATSKSLSESERNTIYCQK